MCCVALFVVAFVSGGGGVTVSMEVGGLGSRQPPARICVCVPVARPAVQRPASKAKYQVSLL